MLEKGQRGHVFCHKGLLHINSLVGTSKACIDGLNPWPSIRAAQALRQSDVHGDGKPIVSLRIPFHVTKWVNDILLY